MIKKSLFKSSGWIIFVLGVVLGMVVYSFLVVPRSKSKETASVVRVVDGDTVDLEIGERVRLIGIDAPEKEYKEQNEECFAEEAKEKMKSLVENKEVRLVKDVSETDKYDRLLRYVFVGEENVSEVMIRDGFARLATYPPDKRYYGKLKTAEKEAKEERLGLWGKCPN